MFTLNHNNEQQQGKRQIKEQADENLVKCVHNTPFSCIHVEIHYQETTTRKARGFAFRQKACKKNSAKHDIVSMSSLIRR